MSEQDYKIHRLNLRIVRLEKAIYQLLQELSNNREHQEFTRQFDVLNEEQE